MPGAATVGRKVSDLKGISAVVVLLHQHFHM
jgi:hypothetical protein